VFERNVERLGFDMGSVEAIVLSHGHWDHCGAMLRALAMIQLNNGGRAVPAYMHPGMYRTRAMKAADGSMRPFGDVPTQAMLEQQGAAVVHATDAQRVLDDLFYVSGEIPRVTAFETGMQGQFRRTEDGLSWEPDPLLIDERFVAVRVKDKGVLVFTACSHAGVVNVITHARDCFPGLPLYGALGGFLLSGSNERVIPESGRRSACVRPDDHCGRPLHRLARGECARSRVRRGGGAVRSGEDVSVLIRPQRWDRRLARWQHAFPPSEDSYLNLELPRRTSGTDCARAQLTTADNRAG
jgi:metal-dependent hydrolase (beta-lactamase superfamily II)